MLSSFPYETWGANFDLQRPTEAGHGEEPGIRRATRSRKPTPPGGLSALVKGRPGPRPAQHSPRDTGGTFLVPARGNVAVRFSR